MYLRAVGEVRTRSTAGYWKVLLDDWYEKRFHVYTILLCLPRPIIRSLIQNTLVHDVVNHRDLANFVFHFMEPTSLPGIYMNSPVRLSGSMHQFINPGNSAQNGRGLCQREWKMLLRDLELYLGDTAAGNQLARQIDKHLPDASINTPTLVTDRRYATNKRQRKSLREWAEKIRAQFVDGMPACQEEEPFLRCPTEVGWSINVQERLSHHYDNILTTHIFGFFHAWTGMSPSLPRTDRFPPTQQFTIARVWKKDVDLAQVAEFTITLLASSLHSAGGLNCTLPGNIPMERISLSEDSSYWSLNAKNMFLRPHLGALINEDFDHYRKGHDALQQMLTIPAREAELQQLKDQADLLRAEIEGKVIEKEQCAKEHQALSKEYLDHLLYGHPSESPLLQYFRQAAVEAIRRVRQVGHGTSRAFADFETRLEFSEPNEIDPITSLAYRATVIRYRLVTPRA